MTIIPSPQLPDVLIVEPKVFGGWLNRDGLAF